MATAKIKDLIKPFSEAFDTDSVIRFLDEYKEPTNHFWDPRADYITLLPPSKPEEVTETARATMKEMFEECKHLFDNSLLSKRFTCKHYFEWTDEQIAENEKMLKEEMPVERVTVPVVFDPNPNLSEMELKAQIATSDRVLSMSKSLYDKICAATLTSPGVPVTVSTGTHYGTTATSAPYSVGNISATGYTVKIVDDIDMGDGDGTYDLFGENATEPEPAPPTIAELCVATRRQFYDDVINSNAQDSPIFQFKQVFKFDDRSEDPYDLFLLPPSKIAVEKFRRIMERIDD